MTYWTCTTKTLRSNADAMVRTSFVAGPFSEDIGRVRLAESAPQAFTLNNVLPGEDPDCVVLDCLSHEAKPIRIHFRFAPSGKISGTVCGPNSERAGKQCDYSVWTRGWMAQLPLQPPKSNPANNQFVHRLFHPPPVAARCCSARKGWRDSPIGEAADLVSAPDEFAHHGGADDASPPEYEDAHRLLHFVQSDSEPRSRPPRPRIPQPELTCNAP